MAKGSDSCYIYIPSLKLIVRPWKWMVGRLLSSWETLFSGAMLVSGRVHDIENFARNQRHFPLSYQKHIRGYSKIYSTGLCVEKSWGSSNLCIWKVESIENWGPEVCGPQGPQRYQIAYWESGDSGKHSSRGNIIHSGKLTLWNGTWTRIEDVYLLLKMVVFHCYVILLEGITSSHRPSIGPWNDKLSHWDCHWCSPDSFFGAREALVFFLNTQVSKRIPFFANDFSPMKVKASCLNTFFSTPTWKFNRTIIEASSKSVFESRCIPPTKKTSQAVVAFLLLSQTEFGMPMDPVESNHMMPRASRSYIWSNYSDLKRPHPKWWFSKGNPLISGKSRLVKYYNLTRYMNSGGGILLLFASGSYRIMEN